MSTRGTLEVKSVTLRFGALVVLDDVSFVVEPGTIHGLIGPNGAGKSSCFNVISGLYRPTSGEVSLSGRQLSEIGPHRRVSAGLGRSFQNAALAPDRSVLDNLWLGRHAQTSFGVFADAFRLGRHERRLQRDRLCEIAEFLKLTPYLHDPVGTLPYGIQKLVDLGRAVATEPAVLLLDEPAAGMGPVETAQIAAAVGAIRRDLDVSVLVVEHDMGFVMGICDQITVLNFGRVIASGSPDAVRSDKNVIQSYLGSGFTSVEEVIGDIGAGGGAK